MAILPYLKIFRDIFQKQFVIFIANIGDYPDWAKINMFALPSIASLDLNLSIPAGTFAFLAIMVMAVIGLFAYWKYFSDPRTKVTSLESQTWSKKSKEYRRAVYILLFFTMTAFQRLNAYVYQLFDEETQESGYILLAFAIILVVDVYFPVYLYQVVTRDKPTFLGFSQSGDRSEFTREQYSMELKNIQSPYKFLFRDYTYFFAFFEIVTMGLKALLQYLGLVARDFNAFYPVQIFLMIYFIIEGIVIFITQPYLAHTHNRILVISSVQNFLMTTVNLFADGNSDAVAVIQVILFYAGIAIYVYLTTTHMRTGKTAPWIRNIMKKLDFTTVIYKGLPFSTKERWNNYVVFNMEHLDIRDFEHEIMLWQRFWEHLFNSRTDFKNPNPSQDLDYLYQKDCPPWLHSETNSVEERFLENRKILEKIGAPRYEDGLQYVSEEHQQNIRAIIHHLQGFDVYFQNPESVTNFGKLYIIPFPFTCSLVYDDCDEVQIFSSSGDIRDLLVANQDQEVNRRRMVRYQLRALDGVRVKYDYTRTKSVTITTGSGESQQSHSVQVTFNYHHGIFRVKRKTSEVATLSGGFKYPISHGFTIALTLDDGIGYDSQGRQHKDRTTIGSSELGISGNFQISPQMQELFTKNVQHVVDGLLILKQRDYEYRTKVANEFIFKKIDSLSYSFSWVVSRDDYIRREELNRLLLQETNPKIKALSQDPYINLMFAARAFYEQSEQHAYWWLFFSDIWHCNSDLKAFQPLHERLSPFCLESICYRYMGDDRGATEKYLSDCRLRSVIGKGFFNNALLDRFFDNLKIVASRGGKSTAIPGALEIEKA